MYDENPPLCLFQIPEEILTDEILARLPVKSLLRFKCVSKAWQSLIESDRFIKIHYRSSAKNPRVIFDSNFYTMRECSLQWLLKSEEGSDPRKKEERVGTIVGCCNGVVCCYDDHRDERLWLWNPAIRERIQLPDIGGVRYIVKFGFGRDETSGAYKVFVVLFDLKSIEKMGRVYSSNTNSWKTIPCGSVLVCIQHGVFLRGNIHWVDWRHSQIECFDLGREKFGRIELPLENAVKVTSYFSLFGEIGRRLSILVDLKKSLEVWVMKEYGVNDSWFKLLTFPAVSRPRNFGCFRLFGEGPNGEILVCDEENLTFYSPKDDAFSTTRNYVDCTSAHLYVESLVSPKRILEEKEGDQV